MSLPRFGKQEGLSRQRCHEKAHYGRYLVRQFVSRFDFAKYCKSKCDLHPIGWE
jgi:hypothetical protein